jgi:STE24 endopeptidase
VSGGAVTLAAEVIAMAFHTGNRASGASRGIGRASLAVQLPAVLAGAGVLVVAAGPYSAVALAAWLLSGLVAMTRAGERVMLRCRGFRSLTSLQRMRLQPVAAAALATSGMRQGDIDWYVLFGAEANAFAAGRCAVAVSTGLLADLGSGRLSEPMVRAVLVHELGHHATSATRYALAVQWLAAPWRVWSRFVVGVCVAIAGRRQPPGLLALVVAAAVLVAVVQAVQRADWVTASALCVLTACAVTVPLVDAAVSRRGEWAADRFAVSAGAGYQLACALTALYDGGGHHRMRLLDRLLARHPEADERIAALLAPQLPNNPARLAELAARA